MSYQQIGESEVSNTMMDGFLTSCSLLFSIYCGEGVTLAFSPLSHSHRSPVRVDANAAAVIQKGQRHTHLFSTVVTNNNVKTATSSSIATATGVADVAFRLGISLEKAGYTHSASAAFHEAATLYQCYLDGGETFNHVTSLSSSSSSNTNSDDDASNKDNELVVSLLAYCCIRLGHLSNDAFGDANAATRLYQLASSIDSHYPNAVSYHGIGTCIEASLATTTTSTTASTSTGNDANDDNGKKKQNTNEMIIITNWKKQMNNAIEAYRKANELSNNNIHDNNNGVGSNSNYNGEIMFHLAVALEVRAEGCVLI
jgi:tetratricopeptide (TPR) repeat protein